MAVLRTGSRPSLQLRNLPRESRRVAFSTGRSGLGRYVLRPARCKPNRTVLRSSWSMAYAAPDGGYTEGTGGDTGRRGYRVASCNAAVPPVAHAAR